MEKNIITGKLANVKGIALKLFAGIFLIPSAVCFAFLFSRYLEWSQESLIKRYGENANAMTATLYETTHNAFNRRFFIAFFLIALIVAVVFYFIFHKTELIVTDKRAYGKTSFGKRVDLPLDSISAVKTGILKTIAITTASGAIKFSLISNRDEVHEALSNLLIERQSKADDSTQTISKQDNSQSSADELMKYKSLLDSGVITQEEFDAKKKQLLGL